MTTAEARVRWEKRLIDAARVLRAGDEDAATFNHETLQYEVTDPVLVWTGPCLLLPPGSSSARAGSGASEVASRPVSRERWAALVPMGATGLRVGDVFELTAEALPSGLVGRTWAIEIDAGSPRDALRELTLLGEELASESIEGT